MRTLTGLILALIPFCAVAMETVAYAPLKAGPVSREVILSGGGATHFACESHDENRRAYHGLYHRMHEFLDGWRFTVGGRRLEPAEGDLELWPWTFRRAFAGGAVESLFMPRRLPGVIVALEAAGPCAFEPHVDIRHIWEVPRPEYRVEWKERPGALFIQRTDWEAPAGLPKVLAIVPGFWSTWEGGGEWVPNDYARGKARRAMERANPWKPGAFRFELRGGETARFAVGLGASEQEAFALARELLDREAELREEARAHFAELAERVPRVEGDEDLSRALTWARYSMDQLVMDVDGPGIYAGYHWFTNFWGRDAFISLPGACLVGGDFERARAILASFAEHQLTDPDHPREGRLPNIVSPDNLQYAGVDGTWWWVRALRIYLDYTRDLEFMREMRPVVDRAIEGALRHAVDDYGLLTHGDGETWMDAGGEAQPRSPRGNRAVEVEALWIDGLDSAALFARVDGDEEAAARYQQLADRARESFLRLFPREDGKGLADHLNPDGSQDLQIRPNQYLALMVPRKRVRETSSGSVGFDTWLDRFRQPVLDSAWEGLVLPHGVTSLHRDDPHWIGRHLDWSRGHFDDAYHNGDVWYWLSGSVIQAAAPWSGRRYDYWPLVATLEDEILEHGALGSLREIRDGEARNLEDYGGATSQAWSLAELLRVFPEGILRLHPQLLDDRVLWSPRPTRGRGEFVAPAFFGGQAWEIRARSDEEGTASSLRHLSGDWPEGLESWELIQPPKSVRLGPEGARRGVKTTKGI